MRFLFGIRSTSANILTYEEGEEGDVEALTSRDFGLNDFRNLMIRFELKCGFCLK